MNENPFVDGTAEDGADVLGPPARAGNRNHHRTNGVDRDEKGKESKTTSRKRITARENLQSNISRIKNNDNNKVPSLLTQLTFDPLTKQLRWRVGSRMGPIASADLSV